MQGSKYDARENWAMSEPINKPETKKIIIRSRLIIMLEWDPRKVIIALLKLLLLS